MIFSPEADIPLPRKKRQIGVNDRYITNAGFIEAIIPPHSKAGFDNTFHRIKGYYPDAEKNGYYIHRDEDVDKWGVEMRLTFTVPNSIPLNELEFGPSVDLVKSTNANELRINSNAFCWGLLELGFKLGSDHKRETIRLNVPEGYRIHYDTGNKIT